jgi:hypothetical protein
MKYLPIKQTHLNADYKYLYKSYNNNNYKFEFQKNYDLNLPPCNQYQDDLIELFKKYMNNDIWINWKN